MKKILILTLLVISINTFGNEIIEKSLKFEGEQIVKNKIETSKWGITYKILKTFNKEYDTKYKVEKITKKEAIIISKTLFYEKYNIKKIENKKLRQQVFDWAFNAGPSEAIKELQTVINDQILVYNNNHWNNISYLEKDGILGSETIRKLKKIDNYKKINKEYLITRIIQYRKKKNYSIYKNGWIKRINHMYYN